VTPQRAEYSAGFSYPGAIDISTYAGTNRLVPCRTIRVVETLSLPPKLIGKRIRVRILIEEDR